MYMRIGGFKLRYCCVLDLQSKYVGPINVTTRLGIQVF